MLYQLWKTRYDNAIDRSEMELEVVTDDLGNDEVFPQTNTRQQRKLRQKKNWWNFMTCEIAFMLHLKVNESQTLLHQLGWRISCITFSLVSNTLRLQYRCTAIELISNYHDYSIASIIYDLLWRQDVTSEKNWKINFKNREKSTLWMHFLHWRAHISICTQFSLTLRCIHIAGIFSSILRN